MYKWQTLLLCFNLLQLLLDKVILCSIERELCHQEDIEPKDVYRGGEGSKIEEIQVYEPGKYHPTFVHGWVENRDRFPDTLLISKRTGLGRTPSSPTPIVKPPVTTRCRDVGSNFTNHRETVGPSWDITGAETSLASWAYPSTALQEPRLELGGR